MTREQITDADFRRAAALLAHYTRNDRAGVDVVIDEAEEAGQMRALCWCLPAVITGLQDGWDATTATEVLSAFASAFAIREAASSDD